MTHTRSLLQRETSSEYQRQKEMDVRSQRLRATLRIGLVLLLYGPCLAQSTGGDQLSESGLQQYQRLAERALDDILPRLIGGLPVDQKASIGARPVVIIQERNPYRSGFVNSPGTPPRFEMSSALVAALDITSDATALAAFTRRNDDLLKYAVDFSEALRSQWEPNRPGIRREPRLFFEQIGLTRSAYESLRSKSEYQVLRIAVMTQTLAWISAHQMAHWSLEPRLAAKAVEPSVSEGKVDELAGELVYQAGFSASPPLANAVLFASVDHPERDAVPRGWACRATEIAARGIQYAERDPSAISKLRIDEDPRKYYSRQKDELKRLQKASGCSTRGR